MIKLLPKQIANQWDTIRAGLMVSLPPIVKPDQAVMKGILTQLLCGSMQCWAVMQDEKLYGHVITYVAIDTATKSKTLNVYSFYLDRSIQEHSWIAILKALERFAKSSDCFRIGAYSRIANMISIAERFGFNSDYRYLTKEV